MVYNGIVNYIYIGNAFIHCRRFISQFDIHIYNVFLLQILNILLQFYLLCFIIADLNWHFHLQCLLLKIYIADRHLQNVLTGDLQHTMTSISAMSHHSKSTVYRHPHLQYFLTADLQRTSIATSVGFYYCRSWFKIYTSICSFLSLQIYIVHWHQICNMF